MKQPLIFTIIVLGLLIAAFTGSQVVAAQEIDHNPPPPGEPVPTNEDAFFQPSGDTARASLGNLNPILNIATNPDLSEGSPAIAHCSPDVYLAVYEKSGDIYGQYMDADGVLYGSAFRISNGYQKSSKPDVACDWYRNKFIVTWQYLFDGDSDYDIRAIGVHAIWQGEYLFGEEKPVANSSVILETNPSIACNSDDHSCLIVFEYKPDTSTEADIYGRRIYIGASDTSLPDPSFMVSGGLDDERNPDLTWGGNDDEYYLVWQVTNASGTKGYQRTIWDTYQSTPPQTKSIIYAIEDPFGTYNPAVAYNSRSGEYLIVYEQRVSGIRIIKVARTVTWGDDIYQPVLPFILDANTTINQHYPAVAYSNGTQNVNDGMGADQFIVTYTLDTASPQVIGQAIEGTYSGSPSQHQGDPVVLDTAIGGFISGFGEMDVTGSINNGKYFAIWEKWADTMSSTNYDIKGRLISPTSSASVFLPLIMR